jgi:hypothetical protein
MWLDHCMHHHEINSNILHEDIDDRISHTQDIIYLSIYIYATICLVRLFI